MTSVGCFLKSCMKVPQVTEETAVAVLNLYPTLLSLARAYSLLVSVQFPWNFVQQNKDNLTGSVWFLS